MAPVLLVLFDMDNVLCRYDRAVRIAELSRMSGADPAAIQAAIWDSGFEALGDSGRIGAAEYLRGFGERIDYGLTLDEWTAARKASMAPTPDMLDLVGAVRRTARVAVLTNNCTLVRDRIDDLFPGLRSLFGEAVFTSAELQASKPDPEVFRRCLARLGAAPAETLFTDDLPENVAGAEQAGLRAHLYTGVEPLAAVLRDHGLL
jgi:putative hydrolase of the HAD superfamily